METEVMNIPSSFPPPGTPLPVPPIINEPVMVKSVPLVPVSFQKAEGQFKYPVIRSNNTGDKVFLLRQGKRHWITSAEKFADLGYTFSEVIKVPDEEFNFYPEGDSV